MKSDKERIEQTAIDLIDALETPVRGMPSIRVVCRENAMRLIIATLTAIWEAKLEDDNGNA